MVFHNEAKKQAHHEYFIPSQYHVCPGWEREKKGFTIKITEANLQNQHANVEDFRVFSKQKKVHSL